jgi:hypothetical protein
MYRSNTKPDSNKIDDLFEDDKPKERVLTNKELEIYNKIPIGKTTKRLSLMILHKLGKVKPKEFSILLQEFVLEGIYTGATPQGAIYWRRAIKEGLISQIDIDWLIGFCLFIKQTNYEKKMAKDGKPTSPLVNDEVAEKANSKAKRKLYWIEDDAD